jgi:pyruvate/2-oxoglutarate dehydrogenase complex dihydrolipoamide dehydrogenase (E3) component
VNAAQAARADMHADVVVVGMGVGGEAVAGQLADAGLDVIGVEAELVGGECPYWACIPSKMMLRAAHLLADARRVHGMAGDVGDVAPDWAPVAERIRDEATDSWDDPVAVELFTDKGGRLLRGRARVLGPSRVEVPGAGIVEARRGIVLATGTTPSAPPVPGLADTPYWTNREAVSTEHLPQSLTVLGGGVVGCELGQAYARFGVAVTIVEAADRLISQEEPEASRVMAEALEGDGVRLLLGARASKVSYADGSFALEVEGHDAVVTGERLLVATGRRPAVDEETWRALGLDGDPGPLPVDERLRVVDGVWAVGDVAGQGAFTHVATYHADIAVRDVLGQDGPTADHRALPRVAFTDPEVGAVGLTEAQARDQGIRVGTGSAEVPSTARGWLHKAGNAGVIKLVADLDRDILVGALAAGPAGGEVLGALAVAVHARVPLATLESMIYAYPTFHRGIQDALRDLRG